MAERAGIGDSEKARDPRAVRAEVIRGFGGHVRVPAGPRGPGGLGRAGRAGAGPVADAGAGPGAVPAAALYYSPGLLPTGLAAAGARSVGLTEGDGHLTIMVCEKSEQRGGRRG